MDEGAIMKKITEPYGIISIILAMLLLILCCGFAYAAPFPSSYTDAKPKTGEAIEADIKLDFQYSNMRAKTNNKTLHCGITGIFKKSKRSPIKLIFENKLTYSKTDNVLDTDRCLLNYQINYDMKKPYMFFHLQSLRDRAMSIDGELSHGAGVGGKVKNIDGQIGFYTESFSDNTSIRGRVVARFPLTKQVKFIIDDTFGYNFSKKNNYRLTSETSLLIDLTLNLAFAIGYDIIYFHDGKSETLDTTRRYYTGINYNF